MNSFLFALAALTVASLCGCTYYSAQSATGARQTFAQLGGKGTMQAGQTEQGLPALVIVFDNEKSFEDFNRTVNTIGTGLILASVQKAAEATKQMADANKTKQAISAGNNARAIKEAEISADVTKTLAELEVVP